MRAFGRDLIRGGHYGQRSCEPHLQAEHMAAPTNAAKREESSCQLGAVHTWHIATFRCGGTAVAFVYLACSRGSSKMRHHIDARFEDRRNHRSIQKFIRKLRFKIVTAKKTLVR